MNFLENLIEMVRT